MYFLTNKYVTNSHIRVSKIVKEIKFEGVCCELESRKCFQRQLVTNI